MDGHNVEFDLVVINPTGVVGSSIVSLINQTHEFFSNMTKGEYPRIIGFEFPFVDVRDVAKAHILAMETPQASADTSQVPAQHRSDTWSTSPTRPDMARSTSSRVFRSTPR